MFSMLYAPSSGCIFLFYLPKWLITLFFLNVGEDLEPVADGASARAETARPLKDGSSRYKLVAFISHMGTSTCVGHYVCHILREGRWVIYNDEKVALSEKTPKKLGYLYLYERIDS